MKAKGRPKNDLEAEKERLVSAFNQGRSINHIHYSLQKRTGKIIAKRTLERRFQEWGLIRQIRGSHGPDEPKPKRVKPKALPKQKSFLPLINKVDNVPLNFNFDSLYKLLLPKDPRPHGFMLPSTVERLPWTSDFDIDHVERKVRLLDTTAKDSKDPGKAATAAIQRVVDAAIDLSDKFPTLSGKHSEPFRVFGANHFVSVERFTAPLFGISSRGAHMTAYVNTSEGMKIWVPRRSAHLFTFPDLLDTTVAGGVKAEDSPFDCIVAEATEEASLPVEFVNKNARAVGAVTYVSMNETKGTFFPTVLYCYDLELPETIEPEPGDDEVSGFKLMTIAQINKAMLEGQFKPNCVLVMLDFFIRHNIITSENEEDYVEIVSRLRRHLPVPTSPERNAT